MEILCAGFLMGIALTIIVVLTIFAFFGDKNNDNSNLLERDNTVRVFIIDRDGNRRFDYRCFLSDTKREEMLLVLYNLKNLCRGHEKETLQEIIDFIDNQE